MEKYAEIIDSYNEYLLKIPNGLNYIIENLKSRNYKLALKSIIDFSEGLVWISEVAYILKRENFEVDIDIKRIENLLEEINNGLAKEDYILVADIFEYELLDFFGNVELIKLTS